jgi:hypothetical protein
MENYFKGFTV